MGAALAVGCVLAAATDAAAGQRVYVTYEGAVTQFTDLDGLFGDGAGVGSRYVSEYVFDLEKGLRSTSATYDQVTGGSAYLVPIETPAVSSRLTINGRSVSFGGDYIGQQANWVGNFTESYSHSVLGGVWSGNFNTLSFNAPLSLETSFEATGTGWGAFHICNFWIGVGCAAEPEALQGIVTTDHVTVRVGAIPEPSAWALAILGFGLAGAALRRSRTAGAMPG